MAIEVKDIDLSVGTNTIRSVLWGSIYNPGKNIDLSTLNLTNNRSGKDIDASSFASDVLIVPNPGDLGFTGSGITTKYSNVVTNSAWKVKAAAPTDPALSVASISGKKILVAGITGIIAGDGSVGITYDGAGASADAEFVVYYSGGADNSTFTTFNTTHP